MILDISVVVENGYFYYTLHLKTKQITALLFQSIETTRRKHFIQNTDALHIFDVFKNNITSKSKINSNFPFKEELFINIHEEIPHGLPYNS